MARNRDETASLLERLERDGGQALGEEFSKHRDRLRLMVEFRLDLRLRGRVSASDILQEAYIEALKRLRHFQADPSVSFFIWLRSVTMQRLIEVHRQHLGAKGRDAAREVRLGKREVLEASSENMSSILGEITSPSQAVQRAEVVGALREAIDRLDPTDREVLALRHFEELSNQEVASLLGIRPAAASKRYVRAIERLKGALELAPGFEEGMP